jgi:hypothetical protein
MAFSTWPTFVVDLQPSSSGAVMHGRLSHNGAQQRSALTATDFFLVTASHLLGTRLRD